MAHAHTHGPGHDHGHHHPLPAGGSHDRAFAIGVGLNLTYVLIEGTAGLLLGSLALVADAGHNLSDVLGLLLAWGAARLARRLPTPRRTYGWRRGTILAALGNALLLLVAVGAIAWEAVGRFSAPSPVETGAVLWVAAAGVVVNFGTMLLFLRGREKDINIQGAFLHMMADGLVTVGVILAALLMGWTGWYWVDPLVALAIAAVILAGTWGLLRDSVNLAMDVVPPGIDPEAVKAWLAARDGVAGVHDLHIWPMGTTETALTVHLVRPGAALDDGWLSGVVAGLRAEFGIDHATLQVEAGDPAHPCRLAPDHVV